MLSVTMVTGVLVFHGVGGKSLNVHTGIQAQYIRGTESELRFRMLFLII